METVTPNSPSPKAVELEKLDQKIASERQWWRRVLALLLLLLLVPIALGIWVAVAGPDWSETAANDLGGKPEFQQNAADALSRNSEFAVATATSLGADEAFQRDTAAGLAANGEFVAEAVRSLEESETFQEASAASLAMRAEFVERAAGRLLTEDGFQAGIGKIVAREWREGAASATLASDVAGTLREDERFSEQVARSAAEQVVSDAGAVSAIGHSIDVAVLADAVAPSVAEHLSTSSALAAKVASAPQFAEAHRNLSEELRALAQRVRMLEGSRGPRSFVLKEGRANGLAELGLTARIDRAADGAIALFELRDASGAVLPLSRAPSRIGDSFRFSLPMGTFEATLSYLLSRRLAKDYIGLEVVPLNP